MPEVLNWVNDQSLLLNVPSEIVVADAETVVRPMASIAKSGMNTRITNSPSEQWAAHARTSARTRSESRPCGILKRTIITLSRRVLARVARKKIYNFGYSVGRVLPVRHEILSCK